MSLPAMRDVSGRLSCLAALILFCAPPAASAELQEQNKALARRFYEQVWFSRNLSAVDELVAPTYVAHDIGDRKGRYRERE